MASDKPNGIWLGIGLATQAQSLFWGAGKCSIKMSAYENYAVQFQANLYWQQNGLGIGISNSLVAVVITSLWDPVNFHLSEPLDTDIQIDVAQFLGPSLGWLNFASKNRGLSKYSADVVFNLHTWQEFQKRIGLLLKAKSAYDVSKPSSRPQIGLFDVTPGVVRAWTSIGLSVARMGPAAVVTRAR